MNCRVNIAAVGSGDIGISYCQEVSIARFCSAISFEMRLGIKTIKMLKILYSVDEEKKQQTIADFEKELKK